MRLDTPEVELFATELFLNDTSGLDSRSQHILFGGEVVRFANSVHFVQVAVGHESGIHSQTDLNYSSTKVLKITKA